MIGAKCLFTDRQRSLVERLSFSVAALFVVEETKALENRRNVGMIGAEHLLPYCEPLLRHWDGFGIFSCLVECDRFISQLIRFARQRRNDPQLLRNAATLRGPKAVLAGIGPAHRVTRKLK